jgi:predicted DNA-binding transcriptional regulator YafY
MANYKQLERLERIVHLLSWKNFISKKDLMEELYERYEIQISERSLERDLKILKESFSLDINYNHQHNGYELEKDERLLSRFFKFAELNSLAKVYEDGLKNYSEFEKWIIPDDSSKLNGIEHINTIVKALNVGLKLKFKTENFHTSEISERVVTPLRLKEYLNRWYLIAVKDGTQEIRNYGIERITDLVLLKESGVNVNPFTKKLNRYNDIVGINYSDEYFPGPVKVVCKTFNYQHKYLATLPLHHSQKITLDSSHKKDEATVSFFLQPNHEFITQLLRMNENIVVIEPAELRNTMRAKLQRALHLYIYND